MTRESRKYVLPAQIDDEYLILYDLHIFTVGVIY